MSADRRPLQLQDGHVECGLCHVRSHEVSLSVSATHSRLYSNNDNSRLNSYMLIGRYISGPMYNTSFTNYNFFIMNATITYIHAHGDFVFIHLGLFAYRLYVVIHG